MTNKTAWLIEWPQSDNFPARWWHPEGGWMMDPNKAIRFARKIDADDYIRAERGLTAGGTIVATEHIWCDAERALSTPEQLAETAKFMDDWAL